MLVHPQFDPVALDLSQLRLPIAIHWYGITYLVGFGAVPVALAWRAQRLPQSAARGWTRRDVEDLLFYGVLGVVIGGRLGYVLFYKPGFYPAHPLEIFAVWQGGMAFHGGLLGVIVAIALFARARQRPFLEVTDLVAPCVPTGLAAGRIGNFINGELWGRFADPSLPWAMVFPQSGSMLPRHPSQLYQFAARGPAALRRPLDLRAEAARPRRRSRARSCSATACCASSPSSSASPTIFLGLLALGMSMGQWLCVPMIVAGVRSGLWAGAAAARAVLERPAVARARRLTPMRQIFLDTETTGLSPESGDRIIEIGCVELVNRRLTGRNLHFYVNPERRNTMTRYGARADRRIPRRQAALRARRRRADRVHARRRDHHPQRRASTWAFSTRSCAGSAGRRSSTTSRRVTDSLSMARDSFPGQSNSLDALCKRLEVDNANRSLHGALLDAGLLAEVYIRMTRGQDSLVIDAGDALAADLALGRSTSRRFELVVIAADEDELAAHDALLAEIDKASGGRTVWRATRRDAMA